MAVDLCDTCLHREDCPVAYTLDAGDAMDRLLRVVEEAIPAAEDTTFGVVTISVAILCCGKHERKSP